MRRSRGQPSTPTPSVAFRLFAFDGGLYDRDTGSVRFGARGSDPELGRWTAKDPSLFGGEDTNLYGNVVGDAVNFTDPTGLDASDWEQAILQTLHSWTGFTNWIGISYGILDGDFKGVDSNSNIIFDNNRRVLDRKVGDVICYSGKAKSEKKRSFWHENANAQHQTFLGPYCVPAHGSLILASVLLSPDGGDNTWNQLEWGPYERPPRLWALPRSRDKK